MRSGVGSPMTMRCSKGSQSLIRSTALATMRWSSALALDWTRTMGCPSHSGSWGQRCHVLSSGPHGPPLAWSCRTSIRSAADVPRTVACVMVTGSGDGGGGSITWPLPEAGPPPPPPPHPARSVRVSATRRLMVLRMGTLSTQEHVLVRLSRHRRDGAVLSATRHDGSGHRDLRSS